MSQDPTFSVLIPSFNAMPFIDATLASVLAQLGPFDELVLQDGGSSDGTAARLQEAAASDDRISLVSERDGGQSDALNRALARARNDYVLWLNADDLVVEGAVQSLRAALSAAPQADLAWGSHRYIRADGSTITDFHPVRFGHDLFMRRGCYIFSGSIAVRTEKLREIGGFTPQFHYCMDLDLMLTLAAECEPEQIIRVPSTIGALRWHDASKSGSVALPFLREGWHVRARHLDGPMDHLRRAEALVALALAHATVGLRHTDAYRRFRSAVVNPISSVKTTVRATSATP